MCRILDDHGAGPRRQRPDLVQIGRLTSVVDRDDRPGPRRYRGRDPRRVDTQRVVADIGKHRGGTDIEGAVRAGDERQRRRDDLVPGTDAGGGHRRVQGRGARAEGHRMAGAGVVGDDALELRDLRSGRQPVRAKHVDDRLHIVVADRLAAVRQQPVTDRAAAVDGQRGHPTP
jgi:hypothetical protein